jgi:DNA-binding transcriptional regulator YiaG
MMCNRPRTLRGKRGHRKAKCMASDRNNRPSTGGSMTGIELQHARKARGLSRRALAALTGLHPDSVRYWERKARVDLRGYAPARILNALGLTGAQPHTPGNLVDFATLPRARSGVLPDADFPTFKCPWKRCGARTRKGKPCRAKALPGKTRCKFHGGASTGPRTAEGKARIAEAQRKRWTAWRAGRDKSASDM